MSLEPAPTTTRPDVDASPSDRVRASWRELRRLGAANSTRRQIFGEDNPLDQGQSDALEYVVHDGPCRMGDLARFMRVEPSTATRAVTRLEGAGLVQRHPDPADARAVVVAATPAGLELHHTANERGAILLDQALAAAFDAGEQARLANLMERLVASIEVLHTEPDTTVAPQEGHLA